LIFAISSASMRLLCSGAHQFGVRWDTARLPAVLATSGIVGAPVAPVPITATQEERIQDARLYAKVYNGRPRRV